MKRQRYSRLCLSIDERQGFIWTEPGQPTGTAKTHRESSSQAACTSTPFMRATSPPLARWWCWNDPADPWKGSKPFRGSTAQEENEDVPETQTVSSRNCTDGPARESHEFHTENPLRMRQRGHVDQHTIKVFNRHWNTKNVENTENAEESFRVFRLFHAFRDSMTIIKWP